MTTPLKEWKYASHQQLGYTCDWSNCGGSHLLIRMPHGEWFDTGLRASNCIAAHEHEHRCWNVWGARTGDVVADLPFITINNHGNSCHCHATPRFTKGGGSILIRESHWHGFLTGGFFYEEGWPPVADE